MANANHNGERTFIIVMVKLVLHFNRNFAPHGSGSGFELDFGERIPTSESNLTFAPQMHLGDRSTGGSQMVRF